MDNPFLKYGPIACAAILYNNCIYMSELGHYAIFPMEEKGILKGAPQGFVTVNGYFVDRILGLKIAEHFNQITSKHSPLDLLTSEDIKRGEYKVLKHIKEYTYKE